MSRDAAATGGDRPALGADTDVAARAAGIDARGSARPLRAAGVI